MFLPNRNPGGAAGLTEKNEQIIEILLYIIPEFI